MKPYNSFCCPKSRRCICTIFITLSLICGAYIVGSTWLGNNYFRLLHGIILNSTQQYTYSVDCKVECRPMGSEALPRGIISSTSNLETIPLTDPLTENTDSKHRSLLAMAVGIKQKERVNLIVEKFLREEFTVMFFHYDGIVDEWNDLEWTNKVIHISVKTQTKWWFAKRFLHPDIVAEYEYIFLWDEDLGVENFHPGRYISIVREEGLEISQPALELGKSKVHHRITGRDQRSRVHRRYNSSKGASWMCDGNSTTPPCVGWVELMAPAFSRSAWRCVWYMIQNDLIHAWGLDKQLGYCAQGDRTVKVGVVDEEYIVHYGLPTLGGNSNSDRGSSELKNVRRSNRFAVRRRSYEEMKAFRNRWDKAVREDECWVDPFEQQCQIK